MPIIAADLGDIGAISRATLCPIRIELSRPR